MRISDWSSDVCSSDLAEEDVAAALVQLEAELAVGHVELEQRVAGHQRHLRQVRDVPGTDDQASRVRIAPDFAEHPAQLVVLAAIAAAPAAPLLAVHRPALPARAGPFVPDRALVFAPVGSVGIPSDAPNHLGTK